MKREFEMSEEDLAKLVKASRPVPYLVFNGVPPRSPQANANAAWAALGRRMGFDPSTVKPVPGKSQRFFFADEQSDD